MRLFSTEPGGPRARRPTDAVLLGFGLVTLLAAIGIPEATAFAPAITTRLCTFYLPPIWGYFAMRWLRQNQYL